MKTAPASLLTCLLIGYLLGSFSPSFLLGRLKGYDIRKSGSGNAGASNVVILLGKMAGLLVILLDILKAASSWWICQALFPSFPVAGVLGGVAAVLGHIYPIWLRFHGGKGLSCLGGVILAHDPKALLLMLGLALLIGIATNYICIVTVAMSVIWPVYYWMDTGSVLGAVLLSVPVIPIFCKHLVNFRRIRCGKELRLSFLWKKNQELERIGYIDEL